MAALIMANGDYTDPEWYGTRTREFDFVICADGGAVSAKQIGILPDIITGDLDSINESVLSFMKERGVQFSIYPPEKDFTDTYLALDAAAKEGLTDLVIWGGTGGRLDHTLANLQTAAFFVKKGMGIRFESPSETVYIIKDDLILKGHPGDTVSVLALNERAEGVTLTGFKYPLNNAALNSDQPTGISNILLDIEARIRLRSGILAVFHNHSSDS